MKVRQLVESVSKSPWSKFLLTKISLKSCFLAIARELLWLSRTLIAWYHSIQMQSQWCCRIYLAKPSVGGFIYIYIYRFEMRWSKWDWRFSAVEWTPQDDQPSKSPYAIPLTSFHYFPLFFLFFIPFFSSFILYFSLFFSLFLFFYFLSSFFFLFFLFLQKFLSFEFLSLFLSDRLSYSYCVPWPPPLKSHRTQVSRRNLILPPSQALPVCGYLIPDIFFFKPPSHSMRSIVNPPLPYPPI